MSRGPRQCCGESPGLGGAALLAPGLEVAGAGLVQDTRLMAIGAHARDDIGSGVIQVEQNITGIAMLGIRPEIDVKALKVTCAQEAQQAETFSSRGPARGATNQADETEIIRAWPRAGGHCMQREEECVVGHGHESRVQSRHLVLTMAFHRTVTTPFEAVSQSKGALHNCRPFPPRPPSWL